MVRTFVEVAARDESKVLPFFNDLVSRRGTGDALVRRLFKAHPRLLAQAWSRTGVEFGQELWEEMVRHDGLNLQYVRTASRSPELCRLAWTQNPAARAFFPRGVTRRSLGLG